ncbi:MAG TPA: polymer-forming cytoskeletal protein [Terriglobales bacterium]|nr:polymer-forming cytoskeletal protein [Terriglobales bacterium]
MWKHKEEEQAEGGAGRTQGSYGGAPGRPEPPRMTAPLGGTANIGRSVLIKGELSGSEDIYLDGTVEGSIELPANNLAIGPNGRVRAGIRARGVIIEGKVEGDIEASERVELRKTAVLTGSIVTQRVSIEDGAYFKGGVDVKRQAAPPAPAQTAAQPRHEVKREGAPVAASAAAPAGSSSSLPKAPLAEQKKS